MSAPSVAVLFARRDSVYKSDPRCDVYDFDRNALTFGGFTVGIDQDWFGHRAQKRTLLYVVGCDPTEIPLIPLRLEEPSHVVSPSSRLRSGMYGYRPQLRKPEREHTPPDLAAWLVALAQSCAAPLERAA